jgi:hypothetical protein
MRGRGGKAIGGWSAAILAALAIATLAPAANASVEIRQSDTTNLLEEFEKSKCKLKAGPFGFVSFSLPANDLYRLDIFIRKGVWKGFGHTYDLFYGGEDVIANVFGPHQGELYGNDFGLPGTPDNTVGAGAIKFSDNGKKFSIGAFGLPDEHATSGVSVTGASKCKYPRRRAH